MLLISLNLDSQVYLLFWVRLFVDFTDAAFEDIVPAHFKEDGQSLILTTRNVTNLILLAIFLIDYHHGIQIMTVVLVTLQSQDSTNLELIPHFVSIVIHPACQVAIHKIHFLCFHNQNVFSLTIMLSLAKVGVDCFKSRNSLRH